MNLGSKLFTGAFLGAFAVLATGCGGGDTPAKSAADENQASSSDSAKPATGNESSAALIDSLLANLDSQARPDQQQPAQSPQQQPTAVSTSDSGSSDGLDTWDSDISRVKQLVPSWNYGTGAVLKFLNESSGQRLTLIFVDPERPVYKEEAGVWVIQAKAQMNNAVVANLVIVTKQFQPGRFEGSPQKQDVIMSIAMGETWQGNDGDTTWSVNEGSWCELTLRPGRSPGDLEGDFRAKLVDNKGTGYQTVEAGYIYINQ